VILAGLIMENLGPSWVWYLAGVLSLISIVGFWLLHGISKHRFSKEELPIEEEVIVLYD